MKDSLRSRTRLSPEIRLEQPSHEPVEVAITPFMKTMLPLLRGICLFPADLKVEEELDGRSITILIYPHTADFRLVCGKDGRQIKALKFLAIQANKKSRVYDRVDVKLEESYFGEAQRAKDYSHNPDFDQIGFQRMLDSILDQVFDEVPHYTIVFREGKMKIYVDTRPGSPTDMPTVTALADLVYPYGFRNGQKIEIRPSSNRNSEISTLNYDNKTRQANSPNRNGRNT